MNFYRYFLVISSAFCLLFSTKLLAQNLQTTDFVSKNHAAKPFVAKNLIVVSINPLRQIISEVVGDKGEVVAIINHNVSEHDYQLKISDLEKINQASLVFYIDENLEKNFVSAAKKSSKTNNYFALSEVAGVKIFSENFSEKNSKKITSKQSNFHLWLDPENAIKIAEFAAEKLCQKDGENCQFYRTNSKNFGKKILKLTTQIRRNFFDNNLVNISDKKIVESSKIKAQPTSQNSVKNNDKKAKNTYVFYHQTHEYFVRYFNLEPVNFETKAHHHEMTISDMNSFAEIKKNNDVKCLFADASDENNSAQKMAKKFGIKFIALDAMGKSNQSYLDLINEISDKIISCTK